MRRLDGLTVLVVDDDGDTRETVKLMLAGRGATVTTAASAAEARERIRLCKPHAVVSDVRMPREDGLALVRSQRSMSSDASDVAFVALSSYASPNERRRAREAGFNVFLSKPANAEAMAQGVAKALSSTSRVGAVKRRTSDTPPAAAAALVPDVDAAYPSFCRELGERTSTTERALPLASFRFRRLTEGSVVVELPGGRIIATFDRIPLEGRDQWRTEGAVGGLTPAEAHRVFAEWTRAGRRCTDGAS